MFLGVLGLGFPCRPWFTYKTHKNRFNSTYIVEKLYNMDKFLSVKQWEESAVSVNRNELSFIIICKISEKVKLSYFVIILRRLPVKNPMLYRRNENVPVRSNDKTELDPVFFKEYIFMKLESKIKVKWEVFLCLSFF